MSTNTLYIDTNAQNEQFLFETTEGSTPTLRVYIYENGTAASFASGDTCKFTYAVNREATEIVELEGTVTVGSNVLDFSFTAAKTAINGKFLGTIAVYNSGNSTAVVQSSGMIILKRDPAFDGATILDTTTTINWGLYTNLPPLPWMIGNDVTVSTDCSDSPLQVTSSDAATTFIHNGSCDYTFILPKATAANVGKGYGFMNLQSAYTITLQCAEGDTIDDSPVSGIKVSIRNYSIPCSVMIRQTTATSYHTIWGDGAFVTEAGGDYSSSSSSSSEEYSSSSSSSA